PVNLGEGINSEGEEVYFSITDDFEYMYLESFAPGTTNRDIVRAPVPEEVKPPAGEIDPMIVASSNFDDDSTITSFTLASIREIDLDQIPVPISEYQPETSVADATGNPVTGSDESTFSPSSESASSNQAIAGNNGAVESEPSFTNEANSGNTASNALAVESSPNDINNSQVTELENTGTESNSSMSNAAGNSTGNALANNSNSGTSSQLDADGDGLSDINSTTPNQSNTNDTGGYSNSNDNYASNAVNSGRESDDEYTANFNPVGTAEFTPNVIRVEQVDGKIRIRYLRNLYFSTGQNELDAEGKRHLDRVHELMTNDPTLIATLSGHSDITGSEKTNLRLSIIRANSAADYLKSKGIPESRIKVNGFGVSQPLASNDDETEGREYNRRVEILLEAEE
ncbi:MAG TPA: hypothetical protein DCR93_01265, partial [Cytophagales bacterium]|nr:hypothetical protein [Cytophagales bacterium]